MAPSNLIGGHCLVAGGLATGGLRYAAEIGAEVMQVFVSNPRGWALSEGKADEDARLRESGIPVYVHASYLVNFGSPNPATLENSGASIRHALRRAAEIGARGVVMHTGSAVSQPREKAMRQVREHLLPLLDEVPEEGPDLLLEPMAGQGAMLCARVEDLGPYLETLDWHPKAGVCLDTCHMFAAGHDLTAPDGVALMLDELHRIAPGRLKLIHANDSKDPCGSKRDRHENIGAGHIGTRPFADLMRHPVAAGVPLCVETPGSAAKLREDIDLLKSLRGS
ncbi:deoxyribonuclease IV [Thermobispora bispora]|jgi:deoxyribonuclease-4|uniref:Probable endonuclease 4 n=1 Tax=Thermobispora bispora (strain ATCC 19993 / DSM 43833 / CBS 139.67 / JCM 10125 / KCTC 9307 / NBRC 14880 / R51) TaxID=469371 RepID=D6Y9C9_THEBD|nr:deoxyribonuclease IV [Thermobispora bispora]ADG88049.1 apurinic endonuclease Apn1 [Thermobispora bispora DSM 43833]MBO2474169.1 deoxyribonuclease IV [Actinomycetales bacterium]QSI47915.1 deoxyribonuclease IV [Thermobispora bispora]